MRTDDMPLPLPPKLPTSTEPHTGPPESESAEMASLMALHAKVDRLAGTLDSMFLIVQEDRKRLDALEGLPDGVTANGHG